MKARRDSKKRILNTGEYQRKDGAYEYRYKDENGARRTIRSWRLVESDKVPSGKKRQPSLRELEKQIRNDLEDGIRHYTAKQCTLNDLWDEYISTKYELKQSTRTNYKYTYDHFVRDGLGKRYITSIVYTDIKKFYMDLIHNRNIKPNSVEVVHTVLNPVFKTAVRNDYIRKNPADGVMGEIKKSHDWTKKRKHPLTTEQQAVFIDFTAQSKIYSHWLPLFTFMLGTGCRVGEVVGLRWDDVDFKNNLININHSLIYRKQDNGECEYHITTTKTRNSNRVIPMFNDVRRALLKERERQMKEGFNDDVIDGYSRFVFCNRYNHVLNPHSVNRAIKHVVKASNEAEMITASKGNHEPVLLPYFSAHILRHTFCTRVCENEMNIKVIQEIMGHADIQTTMDIYTEATLDKKRASFSELEGKIKIC